MSSTPVAGKRRRWPKGAAVARWRHHPEHHIQITSTPFLSGFTKEKLVEGFDIQRGNWPYCTVSALIPVTPLARELMAMEAGCYHKRPRRRYHVTRCERCNTIVEKEFA